MQIVFFRVAIIVTIFFCSNVIGQVNMSLTASSADAWNDRSEEGKRAYLDGFCEGAANQDTGRLYCVGTLKTFTPNAKKAFCLDIFPPFGIAPGGNGVAFVDSFYRDRNHSDLPIWVAVSAYNDKACSENRVTSAIPKLQRKFLCLRQTHELIAMGVQSDVINTQKEKCRTNQ